MDEAVEAVDLGGYTGVGQRLGVGLGFVARGVGLRSQDGVGAYRLICDGVADRDYDGFAMGSGGVATAGEFTGVARAKFVDVVSAAVAS